LDGWKVEIDDMASMRMNSLPKRLFGMIIPIQTVRQYCIVPQAPSFASAKHGI